MRVVSPSRQVQAFGVAALGVVVLSPDALMIKILNVDLWSLVFYRNVFLAIFVLAVYFVRRRSAISDVGGGLVGVGGLGGHSDLVGAGGLAGALYGLSAICFVLAVRQTTAANAVVILGALPMAAAVMRRVFLKQSTPWRTWVAAASVMTALAYLGAAEFGKADLWGVVAACGAMLLYSGHVTILSARPQLDRVAVLGVGAALAAVLAVLMATNLAVSLVLTPTQLGLLAVLGVVVVGGAHMAFGMATRVLSGPEVALVILLEMVLGPFWVWLALGEVPAQDTVLVGAAIAISVGLHGVISLRVKASAIA